MQIPILARRGQKKPWGSVPRINWAHPLTRNLVSYGYDAGAGPIDLVTGGMRTINTAAAVTGNRPSPFGSGFLYNKNGGATTGPATVSLPGSAQIGALTTAAPYSFGCGLMLTVTPTQAAAGTTLFGTGETISSPVLLSCGVVAADDFAFEFADGTLQTTASGLNTINKYHSLLGVALTSATTACYVDGKLSISPAVTTTLTDTTQIPNFAGFGTNAANGELFPDGFIYYGALWKGRALTAIEAAQLHLDPYCFLIYPEDDVFATLVGITAAVTTSEDRWHQPWSSVGRRYAIIAAG